MRVLDWIMLITGGLLTGIVMLVVFVFSFRFFLAFGPFIILFGMMRDFAREKKQNEV